MSEQRKMTIAKIVLGETKTGKPVADLYSDNICFEYPELQLFDLSKLFTVGVDPNTLQEGQAHWCRFYAYYTESSKRNKNGNPYKDIVRIEPADVPGDSDAIVAEIRDLHDTVADLGSHVLDLIRTIENAFFAGNVEEVLHQKHESAVEQIRAGTPPQMERDGAMLVEPTPEERHKRQQPEPAPVLDEEQAQRAFFQEAGPVVNDKILTPKEIREWKAAVDAKRISWRDALEQLRARVQEAS